MQVLETIAEMRAARRALRERHGNIGFVPTMGNLHDGHLALVDYARQRCGAVVVSIYVNPLQFGENEDLDGYPRTLETDTEALRERGVATVFTPGESTMYPRGAERQTRVVVPDIGKILCGAFRPCHFQGVTTVVARLLNIVEPDVAVFGRKDYQQLVMIRRMVEDLAMPVDIAGVETARADDGLALSSRNQYLTRQERRIAPGLYRVLQDCVRRIRAGSGIDTVCREGLNELEALGFVPDYLEVREAGDLGVARDASGERVVLGAARLGRARLIDNLEFEL